MKGQAVQLAKDKSDLSFRKSTATYVIKILGSNEKGRPSFTQHKRLNTYSHRQAFIIELGCDINRQRTNFCSTEWSKNIGLCHYQRNRQDCAVPAANQFVHPILTCRLQGIRPLLENTAIQVHSTTIPNLDPLMTKYSYKFSRKL
jgi:hypothetical protein